MCKLPVIRAIIKLKKQLLLRKFLYLSPTDGFPPLLLNITSSVDFSMLWLVILMSRGPFTLARATVSPVKYNIKFLEVMF